MRRFDELCAGLGLAAVALGGCAGHGETDDLGEPGPALRVESTDGGRLHAAILVDGERIDVTSWTADGVRASTVTGEDGTPYAAWVMELDDMETHGSYGTQTFGRVEDAETDMDLELWTDIASSRVGAVLDQVSAGAAALAEGGGYPDIADELATLGKMGPNLRAMAMARDGTGEVEQGAECNYWNGWYGLNVCPPGDPWVYAYTFEPHSWCTRRYYVTVYHPDYSYVDGTSCGGCDAYTSFYSYTCACKRSRHWDSDLPGSPSWRWDC